MSRAIAAAGLAVMVACSSPALELSVSGGGSIRTEPGKTVTFGAGPIVGQGGPIAIQGQGRWESADLTKIEGIFLVNPDENSGQQPGIVTDRATRQFKSVHRPEGLVLQPGERWFVVMTVSAKTRGTFPVPDVILEYGDGQQLVIPMKMIITAR